MKNIEYILSEIKKENQKSNYWLLFDYRELKNTTLPRRTEIAKTLYPECGDSITIVNSSKNIVKGAFKRKFASPKNGNRLMAKIDELTSEVGTEFYVLKAPDDLHPTPEIFWNFWFLIVCRSNEIAIGLSCSACD